MSETRCMPIQLKRERIQQMEDEAMMHAVLFEKSGNSRLKEEALRVAIYFESLRQKKKK